MQKSPQPNAQSHAKSIAKEIAKEIAWRCPCDKHARLKAIGGGEGGGNGFVCAVSTCYHAKPKNRFRIVAGIPILVSTHMCDTVCDPAQMDFYDKPAAKSTYYRILKLMAGKSKTTGRNCREFVRRVKSLTKKPKVLVIGGGERGAMTE